MAIKKMELAWIVSTDLNKAKEFYQDVLGLQVKNFTPEHKWMELVGKDGGLSLGVGEYNPEMPDEPGQNAVMTLTVDDIEETILDLESKGIEFIDEVMEVPGHVKMITFKDPDGNKFQLVEHIENNK